MDVKLVVILIYMLMSFSGGTVSHGGTEDDTQIKNVHLIFMNHLDVGYSLNLLPGYLVDVLNAYFNVYFPRAILIAGQLKMLKYVETFIYTTHPWLVSMYLDCPPNLVLSGRKLKCPSASAVEDFKAAILSGYITWHAGPMNMEYEMIDQSMAEFAIQLSIDLDKRFGISRKYRTVSQRDVPGTTKAVIPILEKMGVAALSIGVNGATVPASVPQVLPNSPPVFMWKSGNSSMLTFYHPDGYPNQYGSAPWMPGGLSRKDCAIVPGLDTALCFAFRSDNAGPPSNYTEVLTVYEIVRSQFRGANITASTFEAFIELVQPFKSRLPVFSQEMGDVWIQGSGSDPRKTAIMRAMFRARTGCFQQGKCSLKDERVYNASRLMLKLGEHTWGLAGNCVDNIHWTNPEFDKMLKDPGHRYLNASNSWEEQRNFTGLALEALGNHTLAHSIRMSLKALQTENHDLSGYMRIRTSDSPVLKCKGFSFVVNNEGYLVKLLDPLGRDWASSASPIGKFVYQTYSARDFEAFFNATIPYSKHFFLGIGKPNMSKNANPESRIWETTAEVDFDPEKCSIISTMVFKDPVVYKDYGAPIKSWVNYTVNTLDGKQGIDITLQWNEKRPTRLPEGLDFVFTPVQQPAYKWWLNKIEELIDPLDVVTNGSQRLHAINRGVYYTDKSFNGLEIVSPDSAVVNVLTPDNYVSAIPLPLSAIKSVTGVAFNLYNNVWETNFIFWYPYRKIDDGQKYRFRLNFS